MAFILTDLDQHHRSIIGGFGACAKFVCRLFRPRQDGVESAGELPVYEALQALRSQSFPRFVLRFDQAVGMEKRRIAIIQAASFAGTKNAGIDFVLSFIGRLGNQPAGKLVAESSFSSC